MKWEKPTGPVQTSKCGCYTIQHATEHNWVAYHLPSYGKPEELGVKPTDAEARTVCDIHEAARKAG